MKPVIRPLSLLFVIFLVMACSCSRREAPEHDVYEVRVNTFLNLRAEPSVGAAIVGRVENGEHIQVGDVSDGWASVCGSDGILGYVSADYIVLRQQGRKAAPEPHADPVPGAVEPLPAANQAQTSATPAANVDFRDPEGLIGAYEREMISRELGASPDFRFVVVTTPTVDPDRIFDHASGILDELSDEADADLSWWQTVKAWFGNDAPSDSIVLLSYISDCRLLQAESNNVALKYIRFSEPETYFALQDRARSSNAGSSILDLGRLIVRAGQEYASRNWFVRTQVRSGSIFDYLCDEIIVQNILPNDSFWHKWIFGWIFAVPFALANFFFVFTGSCVGAMSLLIVVYLLLTYWMSRVLASAGGPTRRKLYTLYAIKFLRLFSWLAVTSLLVYTLPSMETIAVMELHGYAPVIIDSASDLFLQDAIGKNWLTVVLFVAGGAVAGGFDVDYFMYSTLSSDRQRRIFNNTKEQLSSKLISTQAGKTVSDLEDDPEPFSTLFAETFGDSLGKSLGVALPLSFVFSGSLLLFAIMYLWAQDLSKAVQSGVIYSQFRRAGLYA